MAVVVCLCVAHHTWPAATHSLPSIPYVFFLTTQPSPRCLLRTRAGALLSLAPLAALILLQRLEVEVRNGVPVGILDAVADALTGLTHLELTLEGGGAVTALPGARCTHAARAHRLSTRACVRRLARTACCASSS